MTRPADHADDATSEVVRIVVERSGGFAGLTRHWEAAAPADDAEWQRLVGSCPWEEAAGGHALPTGADRFAWTLTAVAPDRRCHAALTEQEATGPWRALIDAVRDAAAGRAPASAPEE